MLSATFSNLDNFVKTRPSLVLFSLCLVFITLTSFCFAYYIDSADRVLNSDEQQNWLYFFKYLNRKHYCIEEQYVSSDSKDVIDNTNAVFVPISLSLPAAKVNVSDIQGYISLRDWKPGCERGSPPEALRLSFKYPKSVKLNTTIYKVCGVIQVPSNFLLPYRTASCSPDFSDIGTIGILTSSNATDSDKSFCSHGHKVKLDFNEQSSKTFEIYLSESERVRLYIHLMWFSSFALLICIVIFCYALCIRRNIDK